VAVHPDTDFEFEFEFEFDKLQLADPRPNEVLVAVEAVGLCHKDIGIRGGALPSESPAVLGREDRGPPARVGAVHEEQASIRHTNSSRTGSLFSPPTKLVCMTFISPTTSIDLI
jgi:hypothetical protein